jgi:hypothetical protein
MKTVSLVFEQNATDPQMGIQCATQSNAGFRPFHGVEIMMSLKSHSVLDYVAGIFLLFVPVIFGFSEIDSARDLFLVTGLTMLAYSACTQYDLSIVKWIPLSAHMSLDVAAGVTVMLAPWLLGYREVLTGTQEIIHYAVALGLFGLVAFTQPQAEVHEVSGIDAEIDAHRDRWAS